MDSPEPDTPKSVSHDGGGDLFRDEDTMGGLLKSLINPTGLQSAWKRIAKRLQVAEKGLKGAQERIETMPFDYVTRSEWNETVVRKFSDNFEAHSKAIQRLEELTSQTAETQLKEQRKLQNTFERVEELERWRVKSDPIILNVEARAEALAASVRAELDASRKDLEDQTEKSNKAFAELQGKVEGGLESIAIEMTALEGRMKEFTTGQVKKVTDELMAWDPSAGLSPLQAGMLGFVRNATTTIKSDLSATTHHLQALIADCANHREDTSSKFRLADKATLDVSLKLVSVKEKLSHDLEARVKLSEMQAFQVDLTTRIENLTEGSTELRTQVITKLSEFCDHFQTVQVAIDDHEHCLRHHAEEIENRASKYDVLICQNQIERSAKKDDFTREVGELRQMLNWQSNKIEGFSLITSGMAAGKSALRGTGKLGGARGKKGGPGSRKLSRAGSYKIRTRQSSVASIDVSSFLIAEDDGGDSEGKSKGESKASSRVMSRGGSKASLGMMQEEPEESTAVGDDKQATSLSVWSEAANTSTQLGDYFQEDDDSEEDSDEESAGGTTIVKQQLEALTMALVGLGHLLLREPKLGQTRDVRLRQEREMLSELHNLRYWITNRAAPPGWDPAKIITTALACAHPREDELKRPSPQVSTRNLKQVDDPVKRQSEEKEISLPSAPRSARGNVRPKLGGATTSALVSAHLSKAPLSARGAGGGGGCAGPLLPPLQGLSAVAAS